MNTVGLKLCVAASLAFLLPLLASCERGGQERVLIVGSTSVQPFAEKLAHAFNEANPSIRIDVQGGGSTAGIHVVKEGVCQIGASSRNLKPGEELLHADGRGETNEDDVLQQFIIARDGIAVVVNKDNPVDSLTHEQVRRIFTGELRDWSDVTDRQWQSPIYPISREDGSGTFGAFNELVMKGELPAASNLVFNSNGAVRETVSSDKAFIGYISLGLVKEELPIRAVEIDGVSATNENIIDGKYPYVRPFLFLTRPDCPESAKKFIDYVLSPEGQELLTREGLTRAATK